MQRYYLWREDAEKGPFSATDLWELRRAGELPDVLLVRVDGSSQWLQIGEIKERLAREANIDLIRIPPRPLAQRMPELPPVVATPIPARAAEKKPGACAWGCTIMLLLIGLFFLIPAIDTVIHPGEAIEREQKSNHFDAYYTAQGFVKQQFPGADSFSDFKQSVVKQSGNVYQVAMTVEGRNTFGGPIRKSVVVEMELSGGTWRHIRTHQQ